MTTNKVITEQELEIDFEERRDKDRPAPLAKNKRLYLQLLVDKFAKRIFSSIIGKLIFSILFIICFLVIYWSFINRINLFNNNLSLLKERNLLQSELQELSSLWSEKELKKIEQKIADEEAQIFDDLPSLAEWLYQKSIYAKTLGLEMQYNISQYKETKIAGTFSLPIKIRLNVLPASKHIAYLRILEYMRSLINENRHLEIDSNQIISTENQLSAANLDIHLWVRSPNKIIIQQSPNSKEDSFGETSTGNDSGEFIQ